MTAKAKKSSAATQETILAYKGFDKNMKCREHQFEIGKTYTHEGNIKACSSGFHACEYPLDVFGYYNPTQSQFAVVEQSGAINRHDDDSKVASSVITVKANIDIQGMVKAAIDFTYARIIKEAKENKKNNYVVTSTGSCGASSNTGNYGASSNTGNYGASSNTGSCGASSNTGYRGASINTGNYGASSNTGERGASFSNGTGAKAETAELNSIAVAVGHENIGRASAGNWLVLVYRDEDWVIKHVKSAKAGKDIKSEVWYKLNSRGKFVEAKNE